jgi:hypothetical protein
VLGALRSATASGADAGLLYGEALLRLGRPDEAMAQAHLCLAGPTLPLAAARAHGLLALGAAVAGDERTCDASWAAVRRSSPDSWLRVQRAWIDHLRRGVPPDVSGVTVPPLSFALRYAVDEARGPAPAWLRR